MPAELVVVQVDLTGLGVQIADIPLTGKVVLIPQVVGKGDGAWGLIGGSVGEIADLVKGIFLPESSLQIEPVGRTCTRWFLIDQIGVGVVDAPAAIGPGVSGRSAGHPGPTGPV